MNRDFLSNFERSSEKKPEYSAMENEIPSNVDVVEYLPGEYRQNVCFVWPNGERIFMEYSRLDSGRINAEYQIIRLNFGNEIAELIGIRLLPLFDSFMAHNRKYVHCDDARYNHLDDDGPLVNEINITNA